MDAQLPAFRKHPGKHPAGISLAPLPGKDAVGDVARVFLRLMADFDDANHLIVLFPEVKVKRFPGIQLIQPVPGVFKLPQTGASVHGAAGFHIFLPKGLDLAVTGHGRLDQFHLLLFLRKCRLKGINRGNDSIRYPPVSSAGQKSPRTTSGPGTEGGSGDRN